MQDMLITTSVISVLRVCISKKGLVQAMLKRKYQLKNCYFITLTFDNQHYQLHTKSDC